MASFSFSQPAGEVSVVAKSFGAYVLSHDVARIARKLTTNQVTDVSHSISVYRPDFVAC